MRIRLVVTVEGEPARWHREVERPYPGVPRAGDWIYLGEGGDGEGLMATPVAVVSWENDGVIALRLDIGADTARFLEGMGFTHD